MNYILLGPPGAGKGTLAVKLKDELKLFHLSTGDLFRYNIKNETELGKKVKEILASGSLVPDEVTVAMVKDKIKNSECANGCLYDGFPRTIEQADSLDKIIKVDGVINLNVDKDIIIRRLSGRRMCKSTGKIYHLEFNPPKVDGIDDETGEKLYQRPDDMPEAIAHRLEVYKNQTEPLINYYKEKNLLIDIDGNGSPEKVLNETLKVLNRK